MDSFELTKMAGAALAALLLIFGTKTFLDIAASSHHSDVIGFALPEPEGASEGDKAEGGAPAKAAFDPAAVAAKVASANAGNGEGISKKCKACHTFEAGGANKVGPNLHGVVGRKLAAVDGFGYSGALKEKGGEWTLENLASFLHKPKEFVSGTKMVFAGLKGDDLADMLAYLDTLK